MNWEQNHSIEQKSLSCFVFIWYPDPLNSSLPFPAACCGWVHDAARRSELSTLCSTPSFNTTELHLDPPPEHQCPQFELHWPLCTISQLISRHGQPSGSRRSGSIAGRCLDGSEATDASDAQVLGNTWEAYGCFEMQVRRHLDHGRYTGTCCEGCAESG